MESLLESTTLRVGGVDILFSLSLVKKRIEKSALSPKQRKRLGKLLQKSWGTNQEQLFLMEYLTHCQCSYQLSQLIGFPVGNLIAHYSSEMCRFRHVLGLADAIHLSLFNMGIQVSFPKREIRKTCFSNKNIRKLPSILIQELINLGIPQAKLKRSSPKGGRVTHTVVRSTTKNRRFRLILHFLRWFPKRRPEKEYVKIIKESLVDEFCVQMGQERPDITSVRLPLFPKLTQKKLNNRFRQDRRGRVRFYKNLLESKSLCAPVGDDMVYEAYQKHRESLCRDESQLVTVPEQFLRELYEYGEKVGRFVAKRYDPYRTKLPNSRATVERSRSKGGARSILKSKLDIQKGPLYLSTLDGPTRPEPFVIGLFGPPGSGKTTSVQQMVSLLGQSLFPGRKGNDLVYSRSCSSEFWDGYNQQPIVVLDDFGQNLSERKDLIEFEQLISVNRYILPMAHLEDKGMTFNSPIVILTTNCAFGSPLRDAKLQHIVEDDMAVWRRFHFPLQVDRRKVRPKKNFFHELSLAPVFAKREKSYLEKYSGLPRPHYIGANDWVNLAHGWDPLTGESWSDVFHIGSEIRERFLVHTDYHHRELSSSWRQVVECFSVDIRDGPLRPLKEVSIRKEGTAYRDDCVTVSQIFPRYPPYHRPKVTAQAIREPLKVRMITKAEASTKCLQPFQRALFEYLKTQDQFALTHGVMWGKKEEFREKLEWIHRIEDQIKKIQDRREEGDLWLSGDYTAATDNFPMSVTNALVEGILSKIDHEPTRQWVRYEVSPHEISYPMGIVPGVQTSGQLMGSLLSFPLLCFLNDFIVRRSGAKEGKYLINGDDVAVLGSVGFISSWKRDAPKVGLSLSLGKNFIDPHFVTVNSQLFYDGHVLHTGKVSLSTRYGKTLGRCFSEMQFYYGFDEELRREFIRRNLLELRKTPRSLSVPFTHGGLGMAFLNSSLESERRAIEVYLSDFLRPFESSLSIPGEDSIRALRVPVGFFSDQEMLLGGSQRPEGVRELELLSSLELNPRDSEEQEDLTFAEMGKTLRLARLASERSVNQLVNRSIHQFPILGNLRYRVIFVEKGKVGFLKERSLHLCLKLLVEFIDHGIESDADEAFVKIHQEFLEDQDPLFGSGLRLSLDEELEPTGDTPDVDRYEHLLPGLEPHLVPYEGADEDLVFLVRGSGEE